MRDSVTTSARAVKRLEDALAGVRTQQSGALDELVERAETVVAETRKPLQRVPYTLRRMTLPEHWEPYLIRHDAGDLTAAERTECDALRKSVENHGWHFVDASSRPIAAVPMVPEETHDEMTCLTFTLRRDVHHLLPPGEPVTFEDYLNALRGCIARAAEGGSYADVTDAAENLLRAFGR